VSARTLGVGEADLFAVNTLEAPDRVSLSAPGDVGLEEGCHTFPAHSITVLSWTRA
jgi:hypothetical protein